MRMLYDRYPELPYAVVAPWPCVYTTLGQRDWVEGVDLVESWLESQIGAHWARWCWNMYSLQQPDLCGVRFARESDSVLFLLRWS